MLDRIGLSLWTMQSTAAAPAPWPALYRRLGEQARAVEALGFHSLWLSEHRGWYDGWCPAPLHAAAAAAAATERLRVGTAMLLLPQHDVGAVVAAARTFDRLSGGRLELGVGLGYRDAEFDALGLRRDRRGRMMDSGLEALLAEWPGKGDGRRPWVGGIAGPAIERAARNGCGLLLPQTLDAEELGEAIAAFRAIAPAGAPVGVTKDVCVAADREAAARFRASLRRHFAEEIGSWWALRGKVGFEVPEALEAQLVRIERAAVAGPPATVAEQLAGLLETGVDFLLLRVAFDFVAAEELLDQARLVAEEVAPLLAAPGATA